MKKLTTLLLAAGMVFAASAPASAVDVKMDGEYEFTFTAGEKLASGQNYDRAGQRMRLGMTFTASENLSGYLQLQAGIGADSTDYDWGTMNSAKTAIKVRQAYIDWMIPQTTVKVRMGKQLFGLPMDAMGKNAIMHPGMNSRDGIVLSTPVTDWMSVTAFWNRGAYKSFKDEYGTANYDTDRSDKSDLFAVSAAMKFDGFSVTPYAMYGAIDNGAELAASSDASYIGVTKRTEYALNSKKGVLAPGKTADFKGADGDAYWFGATASMTYFDPFVLKVSGAYGVMNYENSKVNDRTGWYMQAKASYKTAYGTPILGAWYASGDDNDAQYARQNWIPTNGGRFHPTISFHDGEDGLYGNTASNNIAGTWGVQAGIEGVSFLDDLSHKFTVTMIKGTNSDANTYDLQAYEYMTNSDTAVEFDFVSNYKIYKNLTACLELAYVINDFDYNDHKGAYAKKSDMDKDAWNAALSFIYKF